MAYFGRGKNKVKNPVNLTGIYSEYVKEFGDANPQSQFINVCDDFYKQMVDNILAGKTFAMPFGIGKIEINKEQDIDKRINHRLNIDWKAYLETGKKVIHLNEHSNGYSYKILWKPKTKLKNAKGYYYVATRSFKRTLVQLIKNKEQDYFEL